MYYRERNEVCVEVGARLKELRKAKKLSQQQVADKLGISRSRVVHHELGITDTTYEVLKQYALLYDVTVDFICGVERKETKLKDMVIKYQDILTDEEITNVENYIKFIIMNRESNIQTQ